MTLIRYQGRRGIRWGFRFWHRGLLHKRMMGPTKVMAIEAEKRERRRLDEDAFESSWGPLKPKCTAWVEALMRYEEAKTDKKTLAWDLRRLRWWAAFCQRHQAHHLQAVSPDLIDRGKRALSQEGNAPATVKQYLAVLRALYGLAIRRWQVLSKNPVLLVDFPSVQATEPDIPSRKQLEALTGKADPILRALIITAVQTGLRKGAILALRVSDLDAQPGFLRVQKLKGSKDGLLPLPDGLRILLLDLAGPGGEIFPRWFPEARWRTLRASVGLPRLRFHDLRHTAGTLLAEAGVSDRVIQQYLGHATPAMTQRYTHPRKPALRAASEILSKAVRTANRTRKSGSH